MNVLELHRQQYLVYQLLREVAEYSQNTKDEEQQFSARKAKNHIEPSDDSQLQKVFEIILSQITPFEFSNPITLDGETLEDVEYFTYLGSIIDEQGGSDADVNVKDWKSKSRIPTIEEHMELKITLNQYQSQNHQYHRQGSSTVWS
ncbi:unnamed protein product [Schistosoma margrebowiei]|uniref:Uncharacterized protein n=1 Tax=Schistosoma margrebowiei TaxID=48269 RepID=A0A183LXC8_9TREM|nr:unnamed protein product [Schistosoma margrebowiei]